MKPTIINIILVSLLIFCEILIKFGNKYDYTILLDRNNNICGLGKTNSLNQKYGKWWYFYPQSGNLSSLGIYKNNLKDNVWIGFYDNLKRNNHLYETIYKDGKVDGAFKLFNLNSDLSEVLYCKKGICYYKGCNFHYNCIDFVPNALNEINLEESLYKSEYEDVYDSEWNHKPFSKALIKNYYSSYIAQLCDCYYDEDNFETFEYSNLNIDEFPKYVKQVKNFENNTQLVYIEYFLLFALIIVNIIILIKFKNETC